MLYGRNVPHRFGRVRKIVPFSSEKPKTRIERNVLISFVPDGFCRIFFWSRTTSPSKTVFAVGIQRLQFCPAHAMSAPTCIRGRFKFLVEFTLLISAPD